MSFWEHFQHFEVAKKKAQAFFSGLATEVNSKKRTRARELISFFALYGLYGVITNLSLYLVFGVRISLLNTIASGGLYYLFVDVVELLSSNGFILFRRKEA